VLFPRNKLETIKELELEEVEEIIGEIW